MKSKIKRYSLIVFLYILDVIITSFLTCYMWNNVISELFGIRSVTIMQGWALSMAITYFQPKKKEEIKDYKKAIYEDIWYTILLWIITFIIVQFAF